MARRAWIAVLLLIGTGAFADPGIPDGFWQSVLQIRDGVQDFGNATVASYFRDVTFQRLELPSGASTTFSITPKSFSGSEVVLEYTILANGVAVEYFDFHFEYKGSVSILYKLSRGKAKVEGFEQMRRIMKEFYLPSIERP